MSAFAHKYGKSIIAFIGAVLTAIYGVTAGDNIIETDEKVQIAIAVATAASVYLVPLAPQYRWAKTAVAAVLATLQALTTVIVGGIESNEWIVLVLAALTTIGVAAAPARSGNGIGSKSPVAE